MNQILGDNTNKIFKIKKNKYIYDSCSKSKRK